MRYNKEHELYLPDDIPEGAPKLYMGMLCGGFYTGGGGGGSGTVTLSGETVSNTYDTVSGIYFYASGIVQRRDGGSYTQVDGTTDWIIPNGSASSLYEIRITNVVENGGYGDFNVAQAAAEDTWINLGATRGWAVQADGPYGADSRNNTFDVQIRYNGGAVLDTGSYTLISDGT